MTYERSQHAALLINAREGTRAKEPAKGGVDEADPESAQRGLRFLSHDDGKERGEDPVVRL